MALAIASISLVSFAQETTTETVVVPTKKYSVETNGFWNNWFIGVSGGVNVFNGVRNGDADLTDRIDPTINAFIGKWHTPGFGWRIVYNGISYKTYASDYDDSRDFYNFHGDAMFNLSNLFCGYNPTRVWNCIPYIGVGYWCNSGCYDRKTIAGNLGLLNNFRLSDHWGINFELAAIFAPQDFDGVYDWSVNGQDKLLSASLGLTYNFNKTGWEKTPDVDAIMAMNAAQLAELNAQLQNKEAENQSLQDQLKKCQNALANTPKKTEAVTKIVSAPQSVFFGFNSSKISSKKEILNLKAIAETAKANNSKLNVVGYADSATGTAAYNQKLSEARAKAVAAELVKLGVPEGNLNVKGEGGVKSESPVSLNRRVIVSVAD